MLEAKKCLLKYGQFITGSRPPVHRGSHIYVKVHIVPSRPQQFLLWKHSHPLCTMSASRHASADDNLDIGTPRKSKRNSVSSVEPVTEGVNDVNEKLATVPVSIPALFRLVRSVIPNKRVSLTLTLYQLFDQVRAFP